MATSVPTKNFEQKAFTRKEALEYPSFGWIRSKIPVPADMKRKKYADVLMKRKLDFGMDPRINSYEKQYRKLSKKKYNRKPLLGIISFLFMLVFLAVAGVELYFGISAIIDNKKAQSEETPQNAAEATTTEEDSEQPANKNILDTVKDILNKVKTDYISKVTAPLEGKTNETTGEYEPGPVDKIKDSLGSPVGDYISVDLLLGVVALIIAILFIIWFAAVCKQPKKRMKNEARKMELRERASEIVTEMRHADPSLMGKMDRKRYLWESIITNAIRNANATDDDDDDDDF